MKIVFTTPLIAIAFMTGCATATSVPVGMKANQFVTYKCEGGKTFQARALSDGSSVRIRYEGGYELDNKGAGIYEADGWKLLTQGAGAAELIHNGKSVGKNCQPT